MSRVEVAICRMLAHRTARGESIAQIARTTRIPATHLAQLARRAKLRYRNARASTTQIALAVRAVVDQGLTHRAAARRHGISKTAVHRFVQARRERFIDRAGPAKFRQELWCCPKHGQLNVYPCVQCLAEDARG